MSSNLPTSGQEETSFICCICGTREHHRYGHNPSPVRDRFFGRCCEKCNKELVHKFRLLIMVANNDPQSRAEMVKIGITPAAIERELDMRCRMSLSVFDAFWVRSDSKDFSKVLGILEYRCCICGKGGDGYGYDPFPVKHNFYGRCCKKCSDDFVSKSCFKCRKASDVLTCSRCWNAKYCSKECQRLDWKYHKKECIKANNREAGGINKDRSDKRNDTSHQDESTTGIGEQSESQNSYGDHEQPNPNGKGSMNANPNRATKDSDDDDDVEEVYTDFKSPDSSDYAPHEEKNLNQQVEVDKLTLALNKTSTKLSKVNQKQIELLVQNQDLKITIKQEKNCKMPPEELLSCQVCTEEYACKVDSNQGFDPKLPVQSQACEHVICYGCVCRMQQTLLETRHRVKWIKCPLCNTRQAFHAEKPIVSRVNVEWIQSQKKVEPSSSDTHATKNDTVDIAAISEQRNCDDDEIMGDNMNPVAVKMEE